MLPKFFEPFSIHSGKIRISDYYMLKCEVSRLVITSYIFCTEKVFKLCKYKNISIRAWAQLP